MKGLETKTLSDQNFLTKDGKPNPAAIAGIKNDLKGLYDHTSDAAAHPEAFAAHEAEADPHPGYLTAAEGNAAYISKAKLIWEGSWASGDITVTDIADWQAFVIASTTGAVMTAQYSAVDNRIYGGGFIPSAAANTINVYGVRINISDTTLTLVKAVYIPLNAAAAVGSLSTITIGKIYGTLRKADIT